MKIVSFMETMACFEISWSTGQGQSCMLDFQHWTAFLEVQKQSIISGCLLRFGMEYPLIIAVLTRRSGFTSIDEPQGRGGVGLTYRI